MVTQTIIPAVQKAEEGRSQIQGWPNFLRLCLKINTKQGCLDSSRRCVQCVRVESLWRGGPEDVF